MNAPLFFGEQAYSWLSDKLTEYNEGQVFVLVDENTMDCCWPYLLERVPQLAKAEVMEIPSGEEQKTLEICQSLWWALTDLGAGRQSILINLGGGVITDMGGFVASCFKRGIDFIHIPTTLLAQVDAAIGGKTGVDLGPLKNQIGLFSPALACLVDIQFLKTLPPRHWQSGWAEVLKYGLASDGSLWNFILENREMDEEKLEVLVKQAAELKMAVVEADPKESGLRKQLNFGHTLGHAIEGHLLGDEHRQLLHGEAVILGMIGEIFVSKKRGLISASDAQLWVKELLDWAVNPQLDLTEVDKLIELTQHDKKNLDNQVRICLLKGLGNCLVDQEIGKEELKEAFEYIIQVSQGLSPIASDA